ncbi:protein STRICTOSIDINE SYNTHASE-LIKE 10-like [Chenopodium quinoa]|uniref:protein STRICTOSIDINE SYNTHASE-LIKE 10-like n=1 Tax=Chenopodium quinoa TaxID=63459 RepID=UPI000B7730E9|nr:protein STRICTOSIDINE SYNTHASE-LIKE 10-like [Chenopodium quinoa]
MLTERRTLHDTLFLDIQDAQITVIQLACSADGVPFRFLNDLDIDSKSGDVYFTDSSSQYHRWEFREIDMKDRSGRLMKYNPNTIRVTVLVRGLSFANGVGLSKNKDFIFVAETTLYQVLRYWLTSPKAGITEVFMKLTGRPDIINRNAYGDFWIAQNPTKPIKINEGGMILESLHTNDIVDCSDVNEIHNKLWIGSVIQKYIIYTS